MPLQPAIDKSLAVIPVLLGQLIMTGFLFYNFISVVICIIISRPYIINTSFVRITCTRNLLGLDPLILAILKFTINMVKKMNIHCSISFDDCFFQKDYSIFTSSSITLGSRNFSKRFYQYCTPYYHNFTGACDIF